jgi:hypothetical protein
MCVYGHPTHPIFQRPTLTFFIGNYSTHFLASLFADSIPFPGDTKQSRLEFTTEITQNKHVKVLHYFVDDIK